MTKDLTALYESDKVRQNNNFKIPAATNKILRKNTSKIENKVERKP